MLLIIEKFISTYSYENVYFDKKKKKKPIVLGFLTQVWTSYILVYIRPSVYRFIYLSVVTVASLLIWLLEKYIWSKLRRNPVEATSFPRHLAIVKKRYVGIQSVVNFYWLLWYTFIRFTVLFGITLYNSNLRVVDEFSSIALS